MARYLTQGIWLIAICGLIPFHAGWAAVRTTSRCGVTSTTSNHCSWSMPAPIWTRAAPRTGRSRSRNWPARSRSNLPAALRGRNKEAIALMRHLQAQDLYDPVLDGLVSAFKYDKTYFDKIVSSVGPLMEKLTTGNIAELISPDYLDEQDTRPIFEWMDVIRRKGIVYVGLDALTDTTVASAVGNSMFADLVSVAGYIYKHGVPGASMDPPPVISMHADEFIPLLNKAGGAGFQVTAYTQTWSDVEARIGNRVKAGQVAGNFNTLIMTGQLYTRFDNNFFPSDSAKSADKAGYEG